MTPNTLQLYLHAHIPLSAAMQVEVVSATREGVALRAPLAPNINHRETVFGGSASALAILSAWSLLHLRLAVDLPGCRLVIQRNTIDYDLPIDGPFSATSAVHPETNWGTLLKTFSRRGKARVTVLATLRCADGRVAGRFSGEFVALASRAQLAETHD